MVLLFCFASIVLALFSLILLLAGRCLTTFALPSRLPEYACCLYSAYSFCLGILLVVVVVVTAAAATALFQPLNVS